MAAAGTVKTPRIHYRRISPAVLGQHPPCRLRESEAAAKTNDPVGCNARTGWETHQTTTGIRVGLLLMLLMMMTLMKVGGAPIHAERATAPLRHAQPGPRWL